MGDGGGGRLLWISLGKYLWRGRWQFLSSDKEQEDLEDSEGAHFQNDRIDASDRPVMGWSLVKG